MAPQTNIKRTVMPNGVRVLSELVPYVDSASVGVWVRAGSRDEEPALRGVSHFIEHMMFKGTDRRSARQIADEMDFLGGHLNAFTDKETTWYYAKTLKEHLADGLDIIQDMLLHSSFDPDEIEREKNVVIEEIKRHEDTPDDMIHDLFTQALWKDHSLGSPVIGTRETVGALDRESVTGYLGRRYTPDRIVVSAAGNLEHEQLLDLVGGTFGEIAAPASGTETSQAQSGHESRIIFKDTEQVHFCIGSLGYSQHDAKKYPLAVLDAMLGGGMSSRLFQEVRENRGLVYAIGSYAMSFQDTGMFTVYAGTSVENLEECLDLVKEEFVKMRGEAVGEEELVRGKNQIKGALVLGQESMSNRISRMANSEIYFGRVIPIEEVIESVMKVTVEDVLQVANELLTPDKLAFAAIGPVEECV